MCYSLDSFENVTPNHERKLEKKKKEKDEQIRQCILVPDRGHVGHSIDVVA